METNANYTAVGIFVILLISAIILCAIWLSSGLYTGEKYSYYKVIMNEPVSGLNYDSNVEYNGVEVGSIYDMSIDPYPPYQINLVLKVKSSTPITKGTTAKLDARALSGLAFMALEDKGKDSTPLLAENGELYPIIQTIPSIYVRLDTAFTELNNNFSKLSNAVGELLNKTNLTSVKDILQSSQSSMQILQTITIPSVNQAVGNLNKITDDLSDVSAEMKNNPAILIRGKEQNSNLGPGER